MAMNHFPSDGSSNDNTNNGVFGEQGYYDGFAPDAEKGAEVDDRVVGPGGRKMSRIDKPSTKSISGTLSGRRGTEADLAGDDSGTDASISVGKQMEMESGNAIKYRTCGWGKTAALLFSEYICLAIMSFPYSYATLGLIGGLICTFVVAGFVLYTSLIVWEFCLRHPEVKDVCDVGQMLFWNYRPMWWFTGVMFILNNTLIQALHCLTGAKYLNTMSSHAECTVVFSIIWALLSWLCSLPRTFSALARLATLSALFTFISVLLATIFAGIEDHPGGSSVKDYWPALGPAKVWAIAPYGTSFVAGMNAFLNISYTFIGQITIPSFIAEMKEPRDFPKAVWLVTICEVILFSLVGGIIYGYTGTNYYTAPAFGSLGNTIYLKISFSFMIPTLIFLGVLYASVSARFIFFRLFAGTRHMGNHTIIGWISWAAILLALWMLAFVFAEVIPFFTDLLSLMSSLFDSFFGFIYWGVAYIRMRQADYGPGFWRTRGMRGYMGLALNLFIIAIGCLFLSAGTYASVESIIQGYQAGGFGGPFSCDNNGLITADQVKSARQSMSLAAAAFTPRPTAG